MRTFDVNKFWNFISNFFTFLDNFSRNLSENFWHGLHIVGEHLYSRGTEFKDAQAPEYSDIDTYENYYEIKVSPLNSIPLKLDPSIIDPKQIIIPKSIIQIEPLYSNGEPIYSDLIEIKKEDYDSIRTVGIGCYVVIMVKNNSIANQFFKISNLKSSEENPSGSRYYNPGSVNDSATYKYIIELENADLSYIGSNAFSFYITTGKSYAIDSYILSIPNLQTKIGIWEGFEQKIETQFSENNDYVVQNGYIEFYNDFFETETVYAGQSLYCKQSDIIEISLFQTYGTLVGIDNWQRYNYNNVNGKAAINTILKSIQNSSNLSDYQKALNIYYGLPVAPQDCKVLGLYESYNYQIINKVGSTLTLSIPQSTTLHKFLQVGTKLFVDRIKEEITIATIVDRLAGTITISSDDALKVQYLDTLNVRLQNKYHIKQISAELSIPPYTPGNIQIYTKIHTYDIPEPSEKIQHIIDITQFTTENSEYPEIIIYGTDKASINYDGIYHIISATDQMDNSVKLEVYNPYSEDEPRYNDFIFSNRNETTDTDIGFVHLPWPTHKFLLLLFEDGTYFKAYIDSPLDTIFDEGDFLKKYDQICRNVSVINETNFPNWNQFDEFKKFNGIDKQSSIAEIVGVIPNTKFGIFFPADFSSINYYI